jgi:hypothetical protein
MTDNQFRRTENTHFLVSMTIKPHIRASHDTIDSNRIQRVVDFILREHCKRMEDDTMHSVYD